jgi:hypothetical protein
MWGSADGRGGDVAAAGLNVAAGQPGNSFDRIAPQEPAAWRSQQRYRAPTLSSGVAIQGMRHHDGGKRCLA